MATRRSTVDYIVEQIGPGGAISARKMFGEYGLFWEGKLVALVCDDQLYVKSTASGRACLREVVEALPYPGAKPSFLITGDHWDDADWLSRLIRATASDLPAPKPRWRSAPRD